MRGAEEQAKAQSAYLELLEGVRTSEGEPDTDAVLRVLRDAGKSCAEFEADYARYRELRELQGRLAERPQVEEALAQAVADWNEAVAERDRVAVELEAKVSLCSRQEALLNAELDRLTRAEDRCFDLQRLEGLEARLVGDGRPVDRFELRERAGELRHLRWAFFSDPQASIQDSE